MGHLGASRSTGWPFGGRAGCKAVDFRVAVLPLVNGEMAVLRLLRRDSIMMSLKDLGFLEQNLRLLLEALALPYGPYSSPGRPVGQVDDAVRSYQRDQRPEGQSDHLEDRSSIAGRSVAGPSPREGRPDVCLGAAFHPSPRPDKVMIGEIRDKETGTIAIEAALTGHLVLSTLHTTMRRRPSRD